MHTGPFVPAVHWSDWLYVELFFDRGNHHEFTSLVQELSAPGVLDREREFEFQFLHVEKPHESYTGANVRLRQDNYC